MWKDSQSRREVDQPLRRQQLPWALRPQGDPKRRRLVMLLTALVFTLLFLQSYAGHYRVLPYLRNLPALLPILVASLAMVAALALATWLQPRAVALCRGIMGAAVVTGLVGLLFHTQPHGLTLVHFWHPSFWLGSPPVAAPLEFIIAGLLGLAAFWNLSWEPESAEQGLGLRQMQVLLADDLAEPAPDLCV